MGLSIEELLRMWLVSTADILLVEIEEDILLVGNWLMAICVVGKNSVEDLI